MLPVAVLVLVFLLIAVRQVGRVRVQIWQAMLLGAAAVLLIGQISPLDAFRSVNPDIMLFLLGMFVVGQALEASGYLSHLSFRVLRRAGSPDRLLLAILFGVGFLSALLMNDTLAIIATPVVLQVARTAGLSPRLMLMALAFSITIGSVMSPIGNPQNLLVAVGGGVADPFVTFFRYLAVPTLLNLLLAFFVLKFAFREHFKARLPELSAFPIKDHALAGLSRLSLGIIVALVGLKVASAVLDWGLDIRLTWIAVLAALPVVLLSRRRLEIMKGVDWTTLVFFASMFVLMASVWDTGFFQGILGGLDLDPASIGVIIGVSVILSQFISNVPLVALYLPVLQELGSSARDLMALAAGSTIAGNLSVLGAASNVIIIQQAEKRTGDTLTFMQFLKLGLPMTALNVLVYYLFFRLV